MFSSKFFEKDHVVQERWFRIKFQKLFGLKLKSLFLGRLHRKLNKDFRFVEKEINDAIETTIFEYRRINEELFPATKQFFKCSLPLIRTRTYLQYFTDQLFYTL